MISPTVPTNEIQRIETLNQLDIINDTHTERFDRITRVMATLFNVPIAMVNFITSDVQFTKSCFGMEAGCDMDRNESFCGHTILSDQPLVVRDALLDDRFKDNPNVINGLKIRAYAGVPLRASDGTNPGALCMIDTKPRDFTDSELSLLKDLAHWAEIELNSSQLRQALDQVNVSRRETENQLIETKRLNELMIGRELKMAEMKQQLAQLTSK